MDRREKNRLLTVVLLGIVTLWAIHYVTVTRFTQVTPMMEAARTGNLFIVTQELQKGADPNRVWNENTSRIHGTNRKGVTPLLFALAETGPGAGSHAPVVAALLQAGADLCATDDLHVSPLVIATEKRDVATVRLLWEHDRAGCLKPHTGEAMRSAYGVLAAYPDGSDDWALVEYLIEHVAQPGEADHPGALVASENPAARSALERLVARGVKCDGESLVLASIWRKADLIPWLVAHGADVNAPVPGIEQDESGPPLVRAAAHPDAAAMRALIDAGADVDAVDAAGRTALSSLVCETSCMSRPNPVCDQQLDALRLLLQRGARRAGTSRFGKNLAWCLRDRPADPYRADIEALLGMKALD